MTVSTSPGRWRRARFLRSDNLLAVILFVVAVILVLAPLVRVAMVTLTPEGLEAWQAVLSGRLSRNLWWRPLGNTLLLGAGVATGCLLIGGFLGWLVMLTDVPFRRFLGVMSVLPFMIPSFAAALAWQTLFQNNRLGGQPGFFQGLGLDVPDWLAWGFVPTLIVLMAHYYSLAYTIIAAGLSSVGADLIEAAQMTGARRARIFFGIVLPVVTPSLVSAGMLTFAGGVSNFAAPAILGIPVRMQTLSTRLYGMMETGRVERGFVIALLLIVISAVILFLADRVVSGRRAFTTVTGKGARTRRFALGRWRWPLFVLATAIGVVTTIIPVLVLAASTFAPKMSALFSDWTLHYWIGEASADYAKGQAGIFRNPQFMLALWTTLKLGLAVALTTMVLGLGLAHTIVRHKGSWISNILSQLAYVPLFIPSIALAAAYIALYGAPIGPMPALYGSFLLLVLAATANLLPYAVQSGRSVLSQISADIEEAAKLTGASTLRRMLAIVFPLTIRGLLAGGMLVFIKIVRDLSLVVLLFTTSTPVLSMMAYTYTGLGFQQFANAITLVILVICLTASLAVTLIQNRVQKWKSA